MFIDPATPQDWPRPQTPYEAEALAFCQSWLNGQADFVLQTSGSTGIPKLITLTRAQMQASARLTGQTLGLKAGDHALVCLNIRYVAGVMMLVRGLELGLPMTVVEPVGNPLAPFDFERTRFDFTAFVPLQLQTILEQDTSRLPMLNSAKAILVGGAATSPALEQALQVIEAPVFATYGMTETVSHIALRRLNGAERSERFTALRGVDLGTDERACLHITSAATNFIRVQTNDVVVMTVSASPGQTQFQLLGRADRIINSGGVKVQPEQIERIIEDELAALGSTARLFVAGLPDERLGQRIVVFCEDYWVDAPQWNRIQQAIRQQIGPYAVPKEIIRVTEFAQTPTGKVDRAQTIDRYR
ncbi:AMP-binding protein [Spirosoma utsteinense]|uniref:O-succinylbenzoic acid--CoA ligase n=1 Tax=Spirosoma utsteinense TaxID=2585773 RepID=A0ABR6VZJ2_9BACT|nr:AMP-binding protein [Spirosoma utsteinense]MBC3784588.1 O-succinylbenzoic acid--CoA ligase [Spirosoma utsteinense]MBC3789660.1 O-succinylbenzoic acid--CoA ligase [Spirosoma utsteinense]